MPKCFTTALAEKVGLPQDRFPKTPQEQALAEEALIKAVENLTFDEHEKIIFDVHGIDSIGDSERTEEQEDLLCDEVDDEIRKIEEDKSAYEHALYLNEDFVRSKRLKKMFLRAERYNVKATAELIIAHFQHKREVFGDGEVLARELMLSDLTDDEVALLESGFVQLLPSRDGNGRAVIFLAPGYKAAPTEKTFQSLSRVHFYFFSSVLRDEDTQKKGIIMVIYNVGKYGKEEEFIFTRKVHQCRNGLPIKLVACHPCHNYESAKQYVTGMQLFMNDDFRNRTRPHISSDQKEINFQLQTYSIPTSEFPINEEETLVLDFHKEWIETQRKHETEKMATRSSSGKSGENEKITLPRRFDVLFGRGRYTRNHTGNLRAAHLVEMYEVQYEQANKFQKTEIAERIVGIIHESYGRFLKWEDSGWVEVSYDTAREKVSHFFRHLRSSRKAETVSRSNSDTSASSSGSTRETEKKASKQKTSARRKAAPITNSKKQRSSTPSEGKVVSSDDESTTSSNTPTTPASDSESSSVVEDVVGGARRVSVC